MKKVIVTITGAAGNIAYSLIFRILSGNIFSADTKIQLNLLDISSSKTILRGVKYEIEDCAFQSLDSVVETDDPETAFGDSDYILLVGAKPRIKGMQRSDLLLDNASIFKNQGECINASSKKTSKIIVVGNPANTNALIVHKHTPNIPESNITSLMRLDQNRAKSILSTKINIHVDNIKKLIVWGNHSATQYPDINNVSVEGVDDLKSRFDYKWVHDLFIPRVQKRGAEIIEFRGKSSAASAASAVYDHLNVIVNGSNDWESMGIISNNKYGISSEVFYSFPLEFNSNSFSIVNDLSISDQSRLYLKKTEKELLDERDVIKELL